MKCNDCHNPHASVEKHLLKDNWRDLVVAAGGDPNSPAEPLGQ
ncbi:MAG: cytochrome c3 family protein [Planctomycetota bacterium]